MKITKYEHACFVVEQDGQTLIVDPGNFAKSLPAAENVAAIVITHEHPDHFDPDNLAAIYDKNPDSILVSLETIVAKMPDHKSTAVSSGDSIVVGPFKLDFFGDKHAEIHSSIPLIDNIGVMINDLIYYPGDSFALPKRPVELLALPGSGPWFKTSDAVDFLLSVRPAKAFSTHDIHNSQAGQALFNNIIGGFAKQANIDYSPLSIGESIEF